MLPSHTRKQLHEKITTNILCKVYQKTALLHEPDGDFTTNDTKCAQISGESGAWWVVDVRGPHRITSVSITSGENIGKYHTITQHRHTSHRHRVFFYIYVLVHRRAASQFLHTTWGHL